MANIKKSFNFRNGVQVDDDNLRVSATGLVGIGTTVPSESLDVRGNVVISGVSSSVTLKAGVATITTLNPTEIIGAGVSIKSGIITASSGIVTFYGDARYLQGMPTSQWTDIDVGLGFTSIYNTGGNVGVATADPRFTVQIGGDVDSSQNGVGISSVGNIKATGIVSATSFVGNVTGNVTGNIIGNVTGNVTGNINSSGISTLTTGIVATGLEPDTDMGAYLGTNAKSWSSLFVDSIGVDGRTIQALSGDLDLNSSSGSVTLKYANGTPKLETASSGVNIVGTTTTGQLSVTGVSTFQNDILFVGDSSKFATWDRSDGRFEFFDNAGLAFGNGVDLTIVHNGSNSIIKESGAGALLIQSDAVAIQNAAGNESGIVFTENGSVDLYYNGSQKFATSGIGVTITNQLDTTNIVASGVITATTELNSPLIGVGTDNPANDIQVRKSGNVEIQITSDTGSAGLTVGRESGTNNTNNAEFRYGGSAGSNYSSAQSLDILNYGTGNFNYHLSAANANAVAGDFHWHKGLNNTRLMTLTGIGGSLGIGITTPATPLHVFGAATISGDLEIGGDINPTGNFNGNVNGNVTGFLIGNVNATVGVSTFNRISLNTSNYYEFGQLSASAVGIGTTMGNKKLVVNSDINNQFQIGDSGRVGIKTDDTNGNALFVNGAVVALDPIGIGTDEPRAAVDFSDAGQATTGLAANRMYMLPPKVDTAQRNALQGVVSGAIIYYTNQDKLQVYVGTGSYNVNNWQNLN